MAEPRYACTFCGTWACFHCGWKRPGASVAYNNHMCGRCPSREGILTPTMHTERAWRRHNGYDGDLPEPHAYGVRPEGKFRISETAPEYYRGYRVPGSGPYGRIDITSWKLGVDTALDTNATDTSRMTAHVPRETSTNTEGKP